MGTFTEMSMAEFESRLSDQSFKEKVLKVINSNSALANANREVQSSWNILANYIIGARFMEDES